MDLDPLASRLVSIEKGGTRHLIYNHAHGRAQRALAPGVGDDSLLLVGFNRGWSGLAAPLSGLGASPLRAMVTCCLWVLIGGGLGADLVQAMVAYCLWVLIGFGQG
jgi:hypothetical protein